MSLTLAIAALPAVLVFALGTSGPARGQESSLLPAPKRVYVMVIDGLRPGDVTPAMMPNLSALKASSTWYKEARATFVTETLPNHAAMMTGVVPRRSGIVGNKYSPDGKNNTYNADPWMYLSDTFVTRLERACGSAVSTATVLSKLYLHSSFAGESQGSPDRQLEADFHWDPNPIIPVSDHAPDAATMDAFVPWAQTNATPQFALVNLGDVDRAGHADKGGTQLTDPAQQDPGDEDAPRANGFQQSAMFDTDKLVGDFVRDLQAREWWDETVLIVLSDHGMNWATEENWIFVQDALGNTPRLDGRGSPPITGGQPGYTPSEDFLIVNNGAAEMIYLLEQDPAERRNMVKAIRNLEGVERVLTDPEDFSSSGTAPQHARSLYGVDTQLAGDVIALAKPGYSFNDKTNSSVNPVPGVHGHSATQHMALLVAGGHPSLAAPQEVAGTDVWPVLPGRAPLPPNGGPGGMSIAPTLAALTGLGEIDGGYDGQPLTEAFDAGALGGSEPFCEGIEPPQPAETGAGGEESPDPGGGSRDPAGGGDPAPAGSAAASLVSNKKLVSYRRPFTLSGQVSAAGGCPRPDWVEIRRRMAGTSAYSPWSEIPVSAGGTWKAELSAARNADYIAVPDATRCSLTASPPVHVRVRAEIVIRRGRACGRTRAVQGVVRPAQPGTQVRLQRRFGKRWRTSARGALDRRSRFRLVPRRCDRGLHRLVWPRQGQSNASSQLKFRR